MSAERIAALKPWRDAGVLTAADIHVADTVARLGKLGTTPEEQLVVLAAALAMRAPRHGHVCLDLETVSESAQAEIDRSGENTTEEIGALGWPTDVNGWIAALANSPIVSLAGTENSPPRPLVLDGTRLYLERYRNYEAQVAKLILERVADSRELATSEARVTELFDALELSEEQRTAARSGATRSLSVIVGGPGTGKTHTVAALLALLFDGERTNNEDPLRIALVAPTGKAAARMGQAIGGLATMIENTGVEGATEIAAKLRDADTSTIHRCLGWRPGSSGFRHDHDNPLPYDVVIVDETSMVSLPLMARLLDAVASNARVILVGDPGQLASVEAGSVLGDIAEPVVDGVAPMPADPLTGCVSVLTTSLRFPADSPVGRFAAAVRANDAEAAIQELKASASSRVVTDEVQLVWYPESADAPNSVRKEALADAVETREFAREGQAEEALAALLKVRVLCAHRNGPFGVTHWNWKFEQWLSGKGQRLEEFYLGRPVLVTRNDPSNDVFNGDLGVVVATEAGARIAFEGSDGVRLLSPLRLEDLETVHAMTIHKSQGSEFERVVVVLPPPESRLATRELLYTAVTRAQKSVVLVGTEESVRSAIGRRVVRASGLRQLLWST